MERKRVVAAFGDVRGFRRWILRANNSPENVSNLMDVVYRHFESCAQKSGLYMKFMGDGFLIILELANGHSCKKVRNLLVDMFNLTEKVTAAMKMSYPRPDGFRVRVAAGHVWKRMTLQRLHGEIVRHAEYIGYALNLAQSLLYVYPEVECVAHESIIEIVGTKKNGLVFGQLEAIKERRLGVDPQDFAGLWSFRMGENTKAVV